MTDGHSRTTVGHRTVRGQDREPPLPCVRACVVRSLARSLARVRASRVRACRVERRRETVTKGRGRDDKRRGREDPTKTLRFDSGLGPYASLSTTCL